MFAEKSFERCISNIAKLPSYNKVHQSSRCVPRQFFEFKCDVKNGRVIFSVVILEVCFYRNCECTNKEYVFDHIWLRGGEIFFCRYIFSVTRETFSCPLKISITVRWFRLCRASSGRGPDSLLNSELALDKPRSIPSPR